MPKQLLKRTKTTHWWNDEPITDVHEALWLLQKDGSSADPIHLVRTYEDDMSFWEIQEPWYREGSSGGDSWGTNYFQIDQAVAERLKAEDLVRARRIPRWGYTETRENELVLSGRGQQMLEDFRDDMRKKAREMLVPGVHTDLSGEIRDRGYDRDHRWFGSFYFEFELPEERGTCRVYPELDKIVMPDDETQAA